MIRIGFLAAVLTLAAACGTPGSLVVLQISKDSTVQALDLLLLHVDDQVKSRSGDVPPSISIGVYLPAGFSGAVSPFVNGCYGGVVRARGDGQTVQVHPGDTLTVAVVLRASTADAGAGCVSPTGAGGGNGAGGTSGAGGGNGAGGTSGASGTTGAGGTTPDASGLDVPPRTDGGGGGPPDAGSGDTPGADAPGADAGRGIAEFKWGAPQSVDVGSLPRVAMGGDNAALVWLQKESANANDVVKSRWYQPGSGWGDPVYLQDPSVGFRMDVQGAPQVAMNSNTSAIAVWAELTASGDLQFTVNDRAPGVPWNTTGRPVIDGGQNAPPPAGLSLGTNDRGRVVFVASGNVGSLEYYGGDSGWEPYVDGVGSSNDALCAQVAVNGGDQAMAVWSSVDSSSTPAAAISASFYDPAHDTWTVTQLDSGPAGVFGCPAVGFDDNGEALAVWSDTRSSAAAAIKTSRYQGGAWDPSPTAVDTGGKNAYAPAVALSSDGRGFVLWEQGTVNPEPAGGGPHDLWAWHYATGAGWDPAGAVSLGATAPVSSERLAVTRTGEAVAVWIQGAHVWANRYAYAAGWAAPVELDASATNPQSHPDVATDGTGRAVAVWEQALPAGGPLQIASSRFE